MSRVATVLRQSARARSMSSQNLARELGEPVHVVHEQMARLAQQATGRPTHSVTFHPSITFDHVIARMGSASAAQTPHGASSPIRPVHVMRPSVLAYALAHNKNPALWRTRWVQRWMQDGQAGLLCCPPRRNQGGDAGAPPSSISSRMPGTPGLYQSTPGSQWFHTVQSGDSPALVAKWITGNGNLSGPGNYVEFVDANPERKTVGTRGTWSFNFASFNPGDKFKVPTSWDQYISQQGDWGTQGKAYPIGGTISAPAAVPTSDDYASTLAAGKVAALKLQLGAWGKKTGIVTTYPGAFDINDNIDEPFHGALSQFQQWYQLNRNAGSTPLPQTTGKLDKPTADALDAYTMGQVTGTGGATPPAATPPPAVASPFGGSPFGMPALASTDLHPDIPGAGGTWKWVDGMYRFYATGSSTPSASVADKSLITKDDSSSSGSSGVVVALGVALVGAKFLHLL